MIKSFSKVATLFAIGLLPASAMAAVSDINGVRIQLRRFNDYSASTLVVTPPPPPPGPGAPVTYGVAGLPPTISFNEGPFGAGGFANQHVARLSADNGATNYLLAAGPNAGQSTDRFDITFDVTMNVGSTAPRKEAGFRFDGPGGESFFFVTSDGEVAAFGGPLPFFSFGGAGTYVPGTRASLRMVYSPDNDAVAGTDGDASTITYFYDNDVTGGPGPISSGAIQMSNTENGFITGSEVGMYAQYQPNDNSANDFANVSFQNIRVVVPEPASLGLFSVAGLSLLARRRK